MTVRRNYKSILVEWEFPRTCSPAGFVWDLNSHRRGITPSGEGSAKKEAFLTALLEGAHNEGEIPSNLTTLK